MKVLNEFGAGNHTSKKVQQLEEFLQANNITIFSRNELFITIDSKEYEVKDLEGSGGGELPRNISSERLVLQ